MEIGTYFWAAGDYNNDGCIDLFITGVSEEGESSNAIYKNNGNGTFTDVTQETGDIGEQEAPYGFWGTDFFDYDNDGDLDIHLTNMGSLKLTNSIYRNNGDGTFTNVTDMALPEGVRPAWAAAAIGDYNNDGALDIYAPNSLGLSGGAFLENRIGKSNNLTLLFLLMNGIHFLQGFVG